ncbi:MAG: efflux RND transporter periplasmic adaptor subunit [Carboxydocellales bacterium]
MLKMNTNVLNKKKISLILLALAGFMALIGCAIPAKPAADPVGAPVLVKTDEVKLQDFGGDLALTGVIDVQEKSNLSAQLPGKVIAVRAKEGTFVKKGDNIISLDKTDLLNQLEQAKAGLANSQALAEQAHINYENSEKDYTRYQELYKSGATSQQQMEQISLKRDIAKFQYEAAKGAGLNATQATINAININLAKMDIKSPINGILVTCNVSVGDTVGPGIPVATIIATNQLALTGNLSESYINYVKVENPVEVTVDSIPNRTFTGKISYVSPISIPTGQFFPVKVAVDNPEGVLKAGMTATAKITVKNPSVLVIPNFALLRRDDKDYVMVVKEGKAVKTAVHTGLRSEESTVIVQGLHAGELIVVQGADRLADGVEVKE